MHILQIAQVEDMVPGKDATMHSARQVCSLAEQYPLVHVRCSQGDLHFTL